jgi:Holliday junction resolvase-like predicted endonuclease
MITPLYVTKSTGEKEIFDPSKLYDSLVRSGAQVDVARRIATTVEKGITSDMPTQAIWRTTMRHLVREDLLQVTARYSLRRGMASLGPDGFTFERLVEAMMQSYGYEVRRGQMIPGASGLIHEVDVLAKQDNRTCFIEAKYRNEYGIKTHIDVTMYNYSRFMDMVERHPESTRQHEAWIVTNTEFTTSSIQYAEYKKMHLIGWDYPYNYSLEDMIVEKKVYPITILPSLTLADRQALIAQGLILAQDLILFSASDLERRFGIPQKRAIRLAEEIAGLLK